MSRGTETIDTVFRTGSSEATIIESVDAVLRSMPESIPRSRTVTRCGPGFALALGLAPSWVAPVDGDGSSNVGNGCPASPVAGWNTSAAALCATAVRYPIPACGRTTMAARSATGSASRRPSRGK